MLALLCFKEGGMQTGHGPGAVQTRQCGSVPGYCLLLVGQMAVNAFVYIYIYMHIEMYIMGLL